MSYIDLKYLPEDHPLRNTALDKIGAEFKRCGSYSAFRLVEPGRPLADNTYNTLEGVWAKFYEWRVPESAIVTDRSKQNV